MMEKITQQERCFFAGYAEACSTIETLLKAYAKDNPDVRLDSIINAITEAKRLNCRIQPGTYQTKGIS